MKFEPNPRDPQRMNVITDDGRTAFEITFEGDHSIMVRGVDTYKAGGKLYACRLAILPNVGNSITVASTPYDD